MRSSVVKLMLFGLVGSGVSVSELVMGQSEGEMDSNNNQVCAVILGASYALGWGEPQVEGWTLVNQGISGDETSGMLQRFESDVIAQSPDAVLIWGFINDIFRSKRETMDDKLARSRENISEMIKLSREADIYVILATEVTVRHEKSLLSDVSHIAGQLLRKESYQDYVNQRVLELNDWMRLYASEEGVPLLELGKVLSDSNGYRSRSFATADGSHISQSGYTALSRYLKEQLKEVSVPGGKGASCTSEDFDL